MWLVLACLLPGVIGATILFGYEYQKGRVQQEEDTIHTARALAMAVDHQLLRVQAIAQVLAESESLARADMAGFHQHARDVLASTGLGRNVVLRDTSGRLLVNTAVDFGTPLPREPARDRVAGVLLTGKPSISEVFVGGVLKRPIVSVDVPVILDGKIVYALGIGILPDHFNEMLKAQGLPASWTGAVLDRSGTIFGRTSSPELFVGKKAVPKLVESIMAAPEGAIEATTKEGTPVRTFYSRSPVTQWGVVIGIPRTEIVGTLSRTLAVLATGVAVLFGVGILLARFMGRRIARSFEVLTAPAVALGTGEPIAVPAVHVREAAELAGAIERAGALLKERDAIIRDRENELTEAHRLARFGTWHFDLRTGEFKASDSLREVFGRDIASFSAMHGTLLSPEAWERLNKALQEVMQGGKGHDLEEQVNHDGGDATIWVNFKCEAIRDQQGEVMALRGTVADITERKLAEERLRESENRMRTAALHDALTGLPNRAYVFEYCERLLAAAQRNHSRGALLFIDLDRFKPINDQYGHEAGDLVLKEVARRLTACTRHEDLVGRLGGDEFVIVLPYLDAARHRAVTVARHVIESISRPFLFKDVEASISPSIGISFYPEHATDVGGLIHASDLAMYQAKHSGRGNYQFYTAELDMRAEEVRKVERRLRNALKECALKLHYQPVVDIGSGRLTGAEALLRLEDRDGESISPGRFIPIAESAGMIGELGEWVAREACRQHAAWREQGINLTIAINVSPLQFRQPAFADTMHGILSETGMDPSCLELEVTESTVMENFDDAVRILNRIKSLGVRIALDDFGTGYSSLSTLKNLPLDKLKLDQSFVRQVEGDQTSRAVTEAILSLGRSLELDVHGEGIESENVLRYLQGRGCNQAQGYLFSAPLPPAEFEHWYWEYWGRDRTTASAQA